MSLIYHGFPVHAFFSSSNLATNADDRMKNLWCSSTLQLIWLLSTDMHERHPLSSCILLNIISETVTGSQYSLQSHLTLCINHVDGDTQQYCTHEHNKVLHFCNNNLMVLVKKQSASWSNFYQNALRTVYNNMRSLSSMVLSWLNIGNTDREKDLKSHNYNLWYKRFSQAHSNSNCRSSTSTMTACGLSFLSLTFNCCIINFSSAKGHAYCICCFLIILWIQVEDWRPGST